MPEYKVKQGDCLSSIAERYGLFWEKVWNHPKNAKLKEKRKDPNILYPGDVVFVPDKDRKEESGATEQRHRFRKKGTPAKLRLKIMEESIEEEEAPPPSSTPSQPQDTKNVVFEDPQTEERSQEDRPRQNIPYILDIDGNLTEGTTDDDGMIEVNIPPNARQGRLILEPGTTNERVLPLNLGGLNPLSEISGIKHRLKNLGFDCGDTSDEATPGLEAALRAFQEKHGLRVTGEADQATKDKLQDLHGS
jgi:LysM repeat protein